MIGLPVVILAITIYGWVRRRRMGYRGISGQVRLFWKTWPILAVCFVPFIGAWIAHFAGVRGGYGWLVGFAAMVVVERVLLRIPRAKKRVREALSLR